MTAALLSVPVAMVAMVAPAGARGLPIPPILLPPDEEETPPPPSGGDGSDGAEGSGGGGDGGGGGGGAGGGGGGSGGGAGKSITVRTGTTGNHSELLKTIPISGRAGGKPRVVMSLPPGKLGALRGGDRLEATAEVQVSVCLKPDPDHRSRRPCIGRVYGYDPSVSAKLVLTRASRATRGKVLGRDRLRCSQRQPNRNHHCVLAIPDGKLKVGRVAKLPCDPQKCYLNLVLGAHDRHAGAGHRLVIGAASDGRRVVQDKGRINFTRLRPGNQKLVKPKVVRAPLRRRIPIASESGAGSGTKAVYSIPLRDVEAGEQIAVSGKLVTGIESLGYNALQRASIALAGSPRAAKGGVPENLTGVHGQIAEASGFNCTLGRSAHSTPCVTRKVGVLEFLKDYHGTVYVNLTVEMRAMLLDGRGWRGGHSAKVRKGGYLRVWRYPAWMNDDPPPVKG